MISLKEPAALNWFKTLNDLSEIFVKCRNSFTLDVPIIKKVNDIL